MHTFVSLPPARTVYVDVPAPDSSVERVDWSAICRVAVVEQGLMTEEEAVDVLFHAAARPKSSVGFRAIGQGYGD